MAASHPSSSVIENLLLPSSTTRPPPAPKAKTHEQTDTIPQNSTPNHISVSILPSTSSTNTTLIHTLTEIINAAYLETESDIWNPGFQRTTHEEVASLIHKGEIAVAYYHHHHHHDTLHGNDNDEKSSTTTTTVRKTTPVGCVHIQLRNPTTAEFGMLALAPSFRGGGAGRKLALFAEEYARTTLFAGYHQGGAGSTSGTTVDDGDDVPRMQLHLLVPTTFEHKFKMRLRGWYKRMGYVEVQGEGESEGDGQAAGSAGKDVASEFPELAPLLAGPAVFYVFEKRLF